MEIWGITIPYTKNRAREVWEIENELEKRLETLDGKIYSGEETSESKENLEGSGGMLRQKIF